MDKVVSKLIGLVGIVAILAGVGHAQSQSKAAGPAKGASSKESKPHIDPNPNKADPPTTLPGKLADAINASTDDKTDYVPCFFTQQQLLKLRPKVDAIALGSGDAEALRSSVMAEALKPENASAFTSKKANREAKDFAREIGNTAFEGRTRSQALSKMLEILGLYTERVLSEEEGKTLKETVKSEVERPENSALFPEEAKKKYLDKLQSVQISGLTADEAKEKITEPARESGVPEPGVSKVESVGKESSKELSAPPESIAAKENVANAARMSLANTGRPLDIGCSMSILSYETMRKAFGETMADEYIGVQIVVRNVNPDKEFLVQSADFKVDDDINGRLSNYYAGVDKTTARGYMLASRELGKRNLMLNTAEGIGSILSAAVPFTGPFVKQFSGVYNSGFIAGLTKVFPDHNTDQLKLIDDEGFSNSRTDRTVVPKSGTAEFVIFISSKQFEEGWWVQDCAERIIIKGSSGSNKTAASCIGNYNQMILDPKCMAPDISVDLDAARRVCLEENKGNSHIVSGNDEAPDLTYFTPKKAEYKDWSPQAVAIFRELSLAVVAGTHVNEDAGSAPSLTKIDCGKFVDEKGDVKLDAAENGVISCQLVGTNIDKVAQLKLRNSKDATDTTTADGTVTTSGQSKSGTASFQEAKLCALNAPEYKVYAVTSDGVESGGDQFLHFNDQPCLSADPSPAQVDLANAEQVTLTGNRLDKVSRVCLASGNITNGQSVNVSGNAKQLTLSIVGLKSPGKISVYLGDCTNEPAPTGKILTVTGTTKAQSPLISSFTPSSAKVGATVTINGSNLAGVSVVKFGDVVAANPLVMDGTIAAKVPSGAVSGPITVTSPSGTTTSSSPFTVLPKTKTPNHSNAPAAKPN
jgi:hypothetical protein